MRYITLNLPLLVAVPAGVVTEMWPVAAPAGEEVQTVERGLSPLSTNVRGNYI